MPAVLEVCRRHGANVSLYAHASVGVIHIRPHIDLKSERGVAAYRAISDEVFALVRVERLHPFAARGVPIVGLEPSCITALRDDYRDFLPGPRTDALADASLLLEQFLAKAWTSGQLDPREHFTRSERPTLLHGHCQQKAVLGPGATRAVLESTSSEVRDLDAGYCGMAGSFGYEPRRLHGNR